MSVLKDDVLLSFHNRFECHTLYISLFVLEKETPCGYKYDEKLCINIIME